MSAAIFFSVEKTAAINYFLEQSAVDENRRQNINYFVNRLRENLKLLSFNSSYGEWQFKCDSIQIGSFDRRTYSWPLNDVDVLLRLVPEPHVSIVTTSPPPSMAMNARIVLENVQQYLRSRRFENVKQKRRCVCVFSSELRLDVDVVPGIQCIDNPDMYWIPDVKGETNRWVLSSPKMSTETLTSAVTVRASYIWLSLVHLLLTRCLARGRAMAG